VYRAVWRELTLRAPAYAGVFGAGIDHVFTTGRVLASGHDGDYKHYDPSRPASFADHADFVASR
jgi:hypothetical protein